LVKKMRKFHEQSSSVVFTFGRFNPPTTGHEKLLDKLKTVSGTSRYVVFPSQSQNQKKDPLPFALKVAYMRKMFPKHSKSILADKKVYNAFDIVVKLFNEKYTDVTMVVGSDRVKEFQSILDKYNGVTGKRHGYYKFNNISVVSAGERDPDAEGVSGMSASKMRAAASLGDSKSFMMGLPKGFKDGQKLFNDVRKYMGIVEERDMGLMTDYEELRDAYLTGDVWNIDDLIEARGITGKIIRRGTNYVSFVDEDNKVHKAWLHEINVNENPFAGGMLDPTPLMRKLRGKLDSRIISTVIKKYMDGVDKGKDKGGDPRTTGRLSKNSLISDIVQQYGLERKYGMNARDIIKYINKLVNKGKVDRKYTVEVKQDPDIKDSPGTEPAKYYAKDSEGKGMSVSTKKKRDAHFTKKKKGSAPGDADAKTKPSKHTNKFKQMYGEKYDSDKFFDGKGTPEQRLQLLKLQNKALKTFPSSPKQKEIRKEINALRKKMGMKVKTEKLNKNADMGDYIDDFEKSDSPQFKGKSKEKRKDMAIAAYLSRNEQMEINEKIEGLVTKAKKSGMPYGILKKVYDRGMAAYKTGHRPGTTAQQWAFARVNSFTTKSAGTWGKADKDLADKVRGEELELDESSLKDVEKRLKAKKIGVKTITRTKDKVTHLYVHVNDVDDAQKILKNDPLYVAGKLRVVAKEETLHEKITKTFGVEFQVDAPDEKPVKTGREPHVKIINKLVKKHKLRDFHADDLSKFNVKDDVGGKNITKFFADMIRAGLKVVNKKITDNYTSKSMGESNLKKDRKEEIKEWFDSNITRAKYQMQHGDDWWWKMNEVHDKILEKLDEDCCEDCITEEEKPCPPATKDIKLNTKNRDATIKNHNYGPLNVDEPGDYWKDIGKYWKTTEEAAKKSLCGNCVAFDVSPRMKDCMPGETSDDDGVLGYCYMHHFKCHSARSCHTWAKGGPIKSDEKSYDWQSRNETKESLWANIHKKRKEGRPMRKKGEKGAPTPAQMKRAKGENKLHNFKEFQLRNAWGEITEKSEYQGRPVELNNPTKGDTKKYKVYVKNDKGNVVKVEYGDPNMSIKRDDPARRKAFRARHGCDDNPGPKWKAKYWSCKFWSTKSVTDLMKG